MNNHNRHGNLALSIVAFVISLVALTYVYFVK